MQNSYLDTNMFNFKPSQKENRSQSADSSKAEAHSLFAMPAASRLLLWITAASEV